MFDFFLSDFDLISFEARSTENVKCVNWAEKPSCCCFLGVFLKKKRNWCCKSNVFHQTITKFFVPDVRWQQSETWADRRAEKPTSYKSHFNGWVSFICFNFFMTEIMISLPSCQTFPSHQMFLLVKSLTETSVFEFSNSAPLADTQQAGVHSDDIIKVSRRKRPPARPL